MGSVRSLLMMVLTAAWGFSGLGLAGTLPADDDVMRMAPYARIISLYAAHTENLLAMGAADRLVGIDGLSAGLTAARGKTVFSYHDDPERFLAARPDLVLIRPMIERGYPRLVMRLRQSGIQVVSVQPTTVDELEPYWRLLGRLSGRAAQADDMTRRFHGAVDAFRGLAARIVHPRRVYFAAIHRKMKTFAPQAMAIFALETAGGVNVADDAPVRVDNNIAVYGKERLLAHADDIDVLLSQEGAMNRASVAEIAAEPGFSVIKAVKTGDIFLVDEAIVSRPTMGLLQGIYRIGCLIYPETYCSAGQEILASAGMRVAD